MSKLNRKLRYFIRNWKLGTRNSRSSFTLIELLVVLAIVAVLSVVVILTLNPAELLKQSRDTTRISDLATLNSALNIFNTDVPGGFIGTSTVVYVSVPDTTSTCANLGLPALPSGYTYNCVNATSTRLTSGRGWIPVNLQSISAGNPISSLPVDPLNTTSTNYYTYVANSAWQISSRLESQKYQPQAALTNNYDPGLYVSGSNTSIAPFVGGLLGWWKLDEGSGTTSSDSSGYGATLQLFNSPAWVAGKVGNALRFSSSSLTYASSSQTVTFMKNHTISAWISTSANDYDMPIIGRGSLLYDLIGGKFRSYACIAKTFTTIALNDGNFHLVNFVMDSTNNIGTLYVDGVAVGSGAGACASAYTPKMIIGEDSMYYYFAGIIDDVRLYGRALSAAEIQALYNSTK